MRVAAVAVLCLMTGACSSILEGTSQNLTFNSVPSGAECTLVRKGETLGAVRTPGTIKVEKTKHPIDATCTLPGHEPATAHLSSDTAAMTAANAGTALLLPGIGLIGWAIDSASGADNKYEPVTVVSLVPVAPPAAPVPAGPVVDPNATVQSVPVLPVEQSAPLPPPAPTPLPTVSEAAPITPIS